MKLLLGDCLEKLKELDDNSVDSIVTDPPYGLSFMGKDWDKVKATQETKSQVVKGLGAGMKMTTLADNIEFEKWVTEWSMECYRVLKPGGYMLAFGGSRMYHRLASGVENAGFEIRDQMMWVYGSGFPKSMNIGIQVDKKLGNQRETVGEKVRGDVEKAKENGAGYLADPANRNNTKQFGYGTHTITKGNSDWEGWGTALKPAHEPIVMGRKPISEKTVADNVLEWGTGGINIDGCRIEFSKNDGLIEHQQKYGVDSGYGKNTNTKFGQIKNSVITGNPEGRFPANIIFDEEAGKLLDEQTGVLSNAGSPKKTDSSKTSIFGAGLPGKIYSDIGGASRFFYCPKTSKSDRNEGNNHPTVKPTDLMAYLIRLVTPKGGIVLDPFMGSGSTGKAAVREGMNFIGIERETEYFEIAKSRIEYEINKPTPKSTKTKKVEVEKKVEEKVNQFFG
jgi:site-specific DNA-methyltransferase (adenine-specific)